jgi:putative restriction endonuclease
MNYWWVNQNQTYVHEVAGGYMWSPKTNTNGGRNRFYDSMTETRPGDVVFSFCDTWIKAIGVVSAPCQSAAKPTEFGSAGRNWAHDGWYVPVRFLELKSPVRPRDHMDVIAPTLPKKYSPLQANGTGNQVYLAPVPPAMADVLHILLGSQVDMVLAGTIVDDEVEADSEQARIISDAHIPATQREQLIKARVGQGLFRSRVELLEPACRVTGVKDRRFLRASHIKSWSKSTDSEKLDGANGLLLAPHVDHLFDKGYVTFNDDGSLQISDELPAEVSDTWSLVQQQVRIPFSAGKAAYLAYHRAEVFRGGGKQKR